MNDFTHHAAPRRAPLPRALRPETVEPPRLSDQIELLRKQCRDLRWKAIAAGRVAIVALCASSVALGLAFYDLIR